MDVFYREAGDPQSPSLVLLHGFPTSSHMFRNLIPELADTYRVIAPDMIGFGQSAMPTVDEFHYTFDTLTDVTAGLLEQLGVDRFAVYAQDYGAPIAWRLATRSPQSVTAIITQNGNAYTEGFVKTFWDGLFAYAENPTPENEAPSAEP
jgi:pimeloyl-ACP methyl ester carboxylesterase